VSEDLRDRLAEALRLNDNPPIWPRGYERQLARLLPVVEEIADERAAEELETAAEMPRTYLRVRAAALRGER
jgi:hypothetical protein